MSLPIKNNNKNSVKIYLDWLGCKLNRAEVELIARQLVKAGYKIVADIVEADIYLLNTCTVTHIADRKSRQLLRAAHRLNPEMTIIATGCYAQRKPADLAEIKGVKQIVGNLGKATLTEKLSNLLSWRTVSGREGSLNDGPVFNTRSFIKVQDGCSNFCSYCIVPFVRGVEKSVHPETVISEIKQRVSEGYQEVVITGTEIGAYDYANLKLKDLLENILTETEVRRLRLSSLQPEETSPELIALWQNERLCRHFHLSLQSGSDNVLARMNRPYSLQDYQKSVALIRKALPEVAITTDVIVGFPGETEAEFAQSYQFCRQMAFARIHVFSYSARQGTRAAQMPGQLDSRVKKERSRQMLELAKSSEKDYYQRFFGSTMMVLFEQQSAGMWSGLSDNYIRVYAHSSDDLTNKLVPVKLIRIRRDGVWGELVLPVQDGLGTQ